MQCTPHMQKTKMIHAMFFNKQAKCVTNMLKTMLIMHTICFKHQINDCYIRASLNKEDSHIKTYKIESCKTRTLKIDS